MSISERHLCAWCVEKKPASMRCSGCSHPRAWYCSRQCQTSHWKHHVFDCNPRQPIKTAYYLYRACCDDLIPDHPQTRKDYGFERGSTSEAQSSLGGLYTGLLLHMGVDPKVLHKWRVKGTLIQEIKASYEALPPASRGSYYLWFLQNEWVLNIALPIPNTLSDQVLEARRRTWVLAGGSASDTDSQIDAKMSVLPKTTQQCHFLHTCLFLGQHPSPPQSDVMWISFGFCACHPPVEEMRLASHYRELIDSCTFDEFVTAFETSTFLTLMHSKGIHLYPFKDMKSLTEVMSGMSRECSVWFLKEFVMTDFPEEAGADESPLALSFRVDYGFVNCRNEEEVSDLKSLYKQILEMRNVHAVDLHRFAIQGKLFEYVGGLVQLKKQKKFKRLLKNPYPLPVV